jgi:serine/threonine protein kinase
MGDENKTIPMYKKEIDKWIKDQSDPEELGGSKCNRYQIIDELGKGGFAKTYLASVTDYGKKKILENKRGLIAENEAPKYVALKVTWKQENRATEENRLEAKMEQDDFELGFEREASMVRLPSHRNNVIVYDAGRTDEYSYIAVEYVKDPFTGTALPLDQAVETIVQSARGISFLHKHGICHRDIKPENMLIEVRSKRPGDLRLFRLQKEKIDEEYEQKKNMEDYSYNLRKREQENARIEFDQKKQTLIGNGQPITEEFVMENLKRIEEIEKARKETEKRLYDLKKKRIKETKAFGEIYGITVKQGDGVKNCDFNIVKKFEMDANSRITTGDRVKGTPCLMAPEAFSNVYSQKTDVYSLGATLYLLATGEPPYDAETEYEIGAQVQNEDFLPVDPRVLNRNMDKDLAVIIAKAMYKDSPKVTRRYRTVDEFVCDLEKWQYNSRHNWFYRLFNKRKINRPDYTPYVFTKNLEPEKRIRTLGTRLTKTLCFASTKYYEAAEKIESIKSKPARWLTKLLLPISFAALLSGAVIAAYYIGKSAAEKNVERTDKNE